MAVDHNNPRKPQTGDEIRDTEVHAAKDDQWLTDALEACRNGRRDIARQLCSLILDKSPGHAEALRLLGVISSQEGDYDRAIAFFDESLERDSGLVQTHYDRAIALRRMNRLEAALAGFDDAIRIDPRVADLYGGRGIVLRMLRRYGESVGSYDEAIQRAPENPAYRINRGNALRAMGRREEALRSFDEAIRLDERFAEAWYNRGLVLRDMGRNEEAVESYETSLRLKPGNPDAFINLGVSLTELKRHDEAVASYDEAIRLRPDFTEAYVNRGARRLDQGEPVEALSDFEAAVRLAPDDPIGHCYRGAALRVLSRFDEALESFAHAVSLSPAYAEAYNNRGNVFRDLGRHDEALADYDRALQLRSHFPDAASNKSMVLLLRGDFAQGLPLYEERWGKESAPSRRHSTIPLWLGEESLAGRSILLHAEQGLGDTLQFCRFAKLVAARGAKVFLEVQRSLVGLLAGLEGTTSVWGEGDSTGHFDFQCPLLSLPLALATRVETIPSKIPYIRCDPNRLARWRRRLGMSDRPRIGIAWSGNPDNRNGLNRSMPFATLKPLLSGEFEWVSLQKELRPEDAGASSDEKVRHFGEEIADYSDTACLCELVDLVISVDTSVAHLAGALGKPVWILLPFAPDWRWFTERDDSPWYPTARLFRQQSPCDWDGVIQMLRDAVRRHFPKDSAPASGPAGEPLQAAILLHQAGKLGEARVLYERLLAIDPANVDAMHLLGVLTGQQGDHILALDLIDRAIAIRPDDAAIHANRGVALKELQRFQDAVISLDRAIALKKDHAAAWSNRGNALRELGRLDEALASADEAVRLAPDSADGHYNRGIALHDLGRLEDALSAYDRVLTINPAYAEAHNNRGVALQELNRLDDAIASFDKAIAVRPDYADARGHKGLALLAQGKYVDGWPLYEWRWKRRGAPLMPHAHRPLWRGDISIHGKTILLHGEQGLGDTIQFCRYASMVAREGAVVILQVPESLVSVMQGVEGVSTVIGPRDVPPAFDVQCPLASLPLAFGTRLDSIPTSIPYLKADATRLERWGRMLGVKSRPRIGVAWSGNLLQRSLRKRSMTFVEILPHLSSRFDWICLQKELQAGEQEQVIRSGVIRYFGEALTDFSETAALCAHVDLVISVDTSIAHLAGAMGKPLWLMLPFAADWRWLTGRADSPWYPSASLYRQAGMGDWRKVLAMIDADLDARFGSTHPSSREMSAGHSTSGLPEAGADEMPIDVPTALNRYPEPTVEVAAASPGLIKADGGGSAESLESVLGRWQMQERANQLFKEGRLDEARSACEAILVKYADHPFTLHLLGLIEYRTGNSDKALILMDRAIHANAGVPAFFCNRGSVLKVLGRHEEALESYDAALRLRADHFDAWFNRGVTLHGLGRFEAALASYEKAVTLTPGATNAWYNRGITLQALGRVEESLESYRRAIALRPEYADAHNNIAVILDSIGRLDEALVHFDNAVSLEPDHVAALSNRGLLLAKLHRYDEALASTGRALAIAPDNFEVVNNRGVVLRELNRLDDVLRHYDKAIALAPDSAEVLWNKALTLLLKGDFRNGLPLYEWRWRRKGSTPLRACAQPLWLGREAVSGRTVLLHSEQGMGDTIQFSRYAALVAARGARVILEVQRPLVSILGRLEGVSQVIAVGDPVPEFDFHCPLLSLPLAFGTELQSVPSHMPYIEPDAADVSRWKHRLGPKAKPRIGIAWSGNPGFSNDRRRSIELKELLPSLSPEFEWVVLQKDVRESDLASLAGGTVRYFGDEQHDFSDTASLCSLMDLVITVDTSVAHLAGAMGKQVWVLLAYSPDWRWLLDRDDSPWYPTARLYRQSRPGEWGDVIATAFSVLHSEFIDKPATMVRGPRGNDKRLSEASSCFDTGRVREAREICREILTSAPGKGEVHHLLAMTEIGLGQPEQALLSMDRAIACNVTDPRFRNDRAGLLMELGRTSDALAEYDAAIALKSDYADAWYNRAILLQRLGRLDDALDSAEKAIALNPRMTVAYNNRGVLLLQLGRLEEARTSCATAVALEPHKANARSNLAIILMKLGRGEEALEECDAAIALDGNLADAHNNRGSILTRLQRIEEAVASFDRAIELRPQFADAHSNRGNALCEANRIEDAIASFDRAISIDPQSSDARVNKALTLLLKGEYEAGLELYEWRLRGPGFLSRRWSVPQWQPGEDIDGKTILLHAEQGLGDTLQFARYARLVAERGARVILEVQAELLPLLRRVAGVWKAVKVGARLPAFDLHCPLPSLPHVLETRIDTIPALMPYVLPSAAKVRQWRKALGDRTRPRIGIVWSGNPLNQQNRSRSIPLKQLLPILSTDIEWISLQKEIPPPDRECLEGASQVRHIGDQLGDFSDTAAVCSLLDVVLTVDTSVAHLAGALGCQVWIMIHDAADWRWLRDREDSPWYPTARLYRQPSRGDWRSVTLRVRTDLDLLFSRDNDSREMGQRLLQAAGLHRRGQLRSARSLYEDVLSVVPEHASALNLLGVMACQQKDFEAALAFFDRVIGIRSEFVDAHINRGIALRGLNRTTQAVQSFDRAIALCPESPTAHFNRGQALAAMGKVEDAISSFDRTIVVAPGHPGAHAGRGRALERLGRLEEALKSYDKAFRIGGALAGVVTDRARVADELRRLAGSPGTVTKTSSPGQTVASGRGAALPQKPARSERMEEAIRLQMEGRLQDAANAYHAILDRDDVNADALHMLGVLECQRNNHEVALQFIDRAIGVDRSVSAFHSNRAVVLKNLGRLDAALASSDDALALDSANADAWSNRGIIFQRMGRPAEALASFERALTINPHFASALKGSASILQTMGRLNESLQKFDAAISLNPGDADAHDGRAVALQGLQRWEEALSSHDQAIALRSDAPDFFNNRGIALARLSRFEEAVSSFDRCLALKPDDAYALNNRANAFRGLNRVKEAIADYERAVRIDPEYAESYNNLGVVLLSEGRCSEAVIAFGGAIARRPDYFEAWSQRGLANARLQRMDEALADCERAIGLKADFAEPRITRAAALRVKGRLAEALDETGRAVTLAPQNAEAWNNRAVILTDMERLGDALSCARKAVELAPRDANSQYNCGVILQALGLDGEALTCYERCLAIQPGRVDAQNNRGTVLNRLNRYEAALECYERVLSVDPGYAEAYNNQANTLLQLGRTDEALVSLERALAIRPDFADVVSNKAMVLLMKGDFEGGLPLYEWRWKRRKKSLPVFEAPLWRGVESLTGKTILLFSEQGLGDTIQFCRYANMFAGLGAKVVLEAQRPLRVLLEQLSGVQRVISAGDARPIVDFWCPLLSLPLAFGTRLDTIPGDGPYLHADPEKVRAWARKLGRRRGMRVGIAWSGAPGNGNDRNRSIPFSRLAPYLDPAVDWIGLQKDVRDTDRESVESTHHVRCFGDDLHDFSDTAALCELMDMVITVDTSIAHLAGAMGKRASILLPFSPDWRWLLDRSDSPWYPTVTLYRQKSSGDWESVLQRVMTDLGAPVPARRSRRGKPNRS